MGFLKAFEDKYPEIDSTFQEFCGSLGIFTVEDFLIYDLNALFSLAGKQFNSVRLKQGIDRVLLIVNGFHRPLLNGVELLKDAHQNKRTLSVAFEGDNSSLLGSLREGFVTELVGSSSSGKTQDHLETIMKNISCYPVFDIFLLFDVLHQLEAKLKTQMQIRQCLVRLLIVDSFSSLIVPVLGGGGPHGHALMISAGNLLKKIAHEYSVCVLVTNHMVAGEGGFGKPALGESWKNVPHVRLLLSHDRETESCSISVVKHPSVAAGKQVKFQIYGR